MVRLWLLLLAILLTGLVPSTAARADAIGLFDGAEPMARRSDAVALVRVDQHVETPSLVRGLLPNTGSEWYVEDCRVLKCFKGGLKEGDLVRLRLFRPGATADSGGFGIASHHVVFLQRSAEPGSAAYQALKYEDSHIQVSPNSDPQKLAGKTLAESVKLLVAEYRRYRAEKLKREDAFFDRWFSAQTRQGR